MALRKRLSSTESSAAIVAGNNDLLTEILLFLPPKLLMRFQLVCKRWYSLISSSSFSQLHVRRHRKPQPSFLLHNHHMTSKYFVYHATVNRLSLFNFRFPFLKVLQSCNGLLLLECENTIAGHISFYVFNPTTLKYRNLLIYKTFSRLFLMFDPSKSPHYKVVCFSITNNPSTKILVYDSESHAWSDGGELPRHGSMAFREKGIYWNGGIYFIRHSASSCCFFLRDENSRTIPSPPRIKSLGTNRRCLTMESNGHLHHVVWYLRKGKNPLYVFEMNGVDSSWFEKYRVDLNPVLDAFLSISLLGIIRGDREEDSLLLFHGMHGKIIIYRILDGFFEVLVNYSQEDYYKNGVYHPSYLRNADQYQFVESLAQV